MNADVKEVLDINRRENDGSIRSLPRARDGDAWLPHLYESRISRHYGDLQRYLKTLPKGSEGKGDDFIYLVGLRFVADRPVNAREGVRARQDLSPVFLNGSPILGRQPLEVWLLESRGMRDGNGLKLFEPIGGLGSSVPLGCSDDHRSDSEFLCPRLRYFQRPVRVRRTWLIEIHRLNRSLFHLHLLVIHCQVV